MADKIVDLEYANTRMKMVLEVDGTIRPMRDDEDGDSVETIRLFDPE